MGYAQVPDTTKVIHSLNEVEWLFPPVGTESTSKIPLEKAENEEVIMDLNELRIADSTLLFFGAKENNSDTTVVIYSWDLDEIQKKEPDRNSKERKAFDGSHRKDFENLDWQMLESRTQQYLNESESILGTLVIENYPHQGVSVFLGGQSKSAHKAWKSYLYKTNHINLKSKKAKSWFNRKSIPYYKASDVYLSNVTHRMGDLITIFQKENGLVKMTVIFKLGYNVSVNKENFPEEYALLKTYVERFSQMNFLEYYEENIRHLNQAIQVVNKVEKKETKVLEKMQKEFDQASEKSKSDPYQATAIEEQKKLLETLKLERGMYLYRMGQYKVKNSEIRMNAGR